MRKIFKAAKKTAPYGPKTEKTVFSEDKASLGAESAETCPRAVCVFAAKKMSEQAAKLPAKIQSAPLIIPDDAAAVPVKIPETEAEAQNQMNPAESRERGFFSFNLDSPLQDTEFMRGKRAGTADIKLPCPKISYINSYFAKEIFITEISMRSTKIGFLFSLNQLKY